jgi:hypothetical protein
MGRLAIPSGMKFWYALHWRLVAIFASPSIRPHVKVWRPAHHFIGMASNKIPFDLAKQLYHSMGCMVI